MGIRLVAADLDGTLIDRGPRTVGGLPGQRRPTPRVLAALEECARRDILVVVVTARRWAGAADLLAELPGAAIAVVAGGTEIRVVPTGRELISRRLPAAIVGAACRRIAACGLQPMVAEGPEHFRAADPRRDGIAASRYLARAGAGRVPATHLGAADATRVLAMGSRSRCNLAARRCAGLPARIVLQDCIVPLDERGERPTELHVAAADKGDALRALCHHLGIAPAATLAIGDAPSDVPMLVAAGVGVLMGQAPIGLRRPAFVRAPSVDADGAAWALERLVLGQAER